MCIIKLFSFEKGLLKCKYFFFFKDNAFGVALAWKILGTPPKEAKQHTLQYQSSLKRVRKNKHGSGSFYLGRETHLQGNIKFDLSSCADKKE